MKFAALAFLFFASTAADYPLHLRILQIEEHHSRYGTSGEGRANLREEDGSVHGIDFTFEYCSHGYKASVGPGSYHARLKKAQRLEIFATEIGSDSTNKCEFKFTPRSFIYTMHDGHIGTKPAVMGEPLPE